MRDDWRRYLTAEGAIVQEGYTESFGNPSLERKIFTSSTVLTDLSHLGLIAVQGADAQKFL
ncbi:MAG: hypothetical protein FD130_2105, partial [Halothiobacillaceae bacterium]